MAPRRFATLAVALGGTVLLAGWIIAAVAGLGIQGIKITDRTEDRRAPLLGIDADPVDAPKTTAVVSISSVDAGSAAAETGTGGFKEAEAVEASAPAQKKMIVDTSITAAAVTVKDTSLDPSIIARTIGDKVSRLRNDVVEWGHKLQELEADLKNSQNVDDTAKSVDGCLVVLRAAADRLAPNSETRATLRKQEDAIRDLAIRAEVHSNQAIRKISDHFQQKVAELHAVNRSFEETRTRLVTEIDRLQELKIRLEFNHAAVHSGGLLREGEISIGNIQTLTADAQRLAGTLCDFGAAPVAHCARPREPATRKRASYPAFGVGPVAGTSYAQGQTHLPTFIAEAPVVAPPSGVLVTQPLAPVAVPLSGVLITQPAAANIQPSAARSGDPSHALLPESRKDDRVATGY